MNIRGIWKRKKKKQKYTELDRCSVLCKLIFVKKRRRSESRETRLFMPRKLRKESNAAAVVLTIVQVTVDPFREKSYFGERDWKVKGLIRATLKNLMGKTCNKKSTSLYVDQLGIENRYDTKVDLTVIAIIFILFLFVFCFLFLLNETKVFFNRVFPRNVWRVSCDQLLPNEIERRNAVFGYITYLFRVLDPLYAVTVLNRKIIKREKVKKKNRTHRIYSNVPTSSNYIYIYKKKERWNEEL